jgi:hypothetical protein
MQQKAHYARGEHRVSPPDVPSRPELLGVGELGEVDASVKAVVKRIAQGWVVGNRGVDEVDKLCQDLRHSGKKSGVKKGEREKERKERESRRETVSDDGKTMIGSEFVIAS